VVVSSKEGRERENEREKMLSEIGRRGRDRPRSRGQRFYRAITESVESTLMSKKRKESGRKNSWIEIDAPLDGRTACLIHMRASCQPV
jgi:hypothetical protein